MYYYKRWNSNNGVKGSMKNEGDRECPIFGKSTDFWRRGMPCEVYWNGTENQERIRKSEEKLRG